MQVSSSAAHAVGSHDYTKVKTTNEDGGEAKPGLANQARVAVSIANATHACRMYENCVALKNVTTPIKSASVCKVCARRVTQCASRAELAESVTQHEDSKSPIKSASAC